MFLVSIRTLGARDKRYIGYARKMSNCSTTRVVSLLLKYHNMDITAQMRINVIRTQQFYPLQVFFPIIWIEPFAQRVQPIISISSNAF